MEGLQGMPFSQKARQQLELLHPLFKRLVQDLGLVRCRLWGATGYKVAATQSCPLGMLKVCKLIMIVLTCGCSSSGISNKCRLTMIVFTCVCSGCAYQDHHC